MKKFLSAVLIVAAFMTASATPLIAAPAPAGAINVFGGCSGDSGNKVCASRGDSMQNFMKNIVSLLIYITGFISVLMIIIGGIRYTTSNGDQGQLTSAKNTILYSVVGLVVAIMAYAIVNFVLGAI